jgi:hypothetical protein
MASVAGTAVGSSGDFGIIAPRRAAVMYPYQ